MQGEFRGDFSRDSFDPLKNYSQVFMQQGRVLLDADWNEQTAILLHFLRTLAADLIGPHGGPNRSFDQDYDGDATSINFGVKDASSSGKLDFKIGAGHYYIKGVLCENHTHSTYTALYKDQPLEQGKNYLVYLDVWERHVTSIDDDSIREIALNGPDTTTRAKVEWRLGVTHQYLDTKKTLQSIPTTPGGNLTWKQWVAVQERWQAWVDHWQPKNRGRLKVRAKEATSKLTDPCNVAPEARYRGENQLYRVEIHQGSESSKKPTFKWSRDNSALEFSIKEIASGTDSTVVTLANLGRDERLSLNEDDWVEIVDETSIYSKQAEPLLQVVAVDRVMAQVTLRGKPSGDRGKGNAARLRRWDHREGDPKLGGLSLSDGAAEIIVGSKDENWLLLENGIQIQFQTDNLNQATTFRTGDYWLVPARAATGDVLWPGAPGNPDALKPHGVQHHYAPLAVISIANGAVIANDCRRLWTPLGS